MIKRIGFKAALYVMGGGVLIPESPEVSESNYQHIHEIGVSGVAHEAAWIRHRTGAKPSAAWESDVRATRENGYVAESAHRDVLDDYRDDLQKHGPATAGSRNMGRRGSTASSIEGVFVR